MTTVHTGLGSAPRTPIKNAKRARKSPPSRSGSYTAREAQSAMRVDSKVKNTGRSRMVWTVGVPCHVHERCEENLKAHRQTFLEVA